MRNDIEDINAINKVLAGDTEKFAFLVEKYQNKVFALILGIVKQETEAEEIAQKVFIKIYVNLSKFKNKAAFSTWMYRIVYNESISYLRMNKTNVVSIDGNSEEIPDLFDTSGEEELKTKLLTNVLKTLNEKDATLIHLYYFESFTVNEISKIMSFSVSKVKIRLYRIRKQLYKLLVKKFEEEL